MAWDTSVVQIANVSYDTYAITGEVTTRDESKWWLTTVYGPQGAEEKILFLQELTERRALCPGPWMVAGDFNMILNASEKNNENTTYFPCQLWSYLCLPAMGHVQ
jgi:hypothetical protein